MVSVDAAGGGDVDGPSMLIVPPFQVVAPLRFSALPPTRDSLPLKVLAPLTLTVIAEGGDTMPILPPLQLSVPVEIDPVPPLTEPPERINTPVVDAADTDRAPPVMDRTPVPLNAVRAKVPVRNVVLNAPRAADSPVVGSAPPT